MIYYQYANINDYSLNDLNFFLEKIRDSKQKKIHNYKKINTKKQSILGELLLKELLEKHTSILYDNCIFKQNIYHKPFIQNYPIYYNISHSHDYVIVIISDTKIGIDIEKIRDYPKQSIKYFCTFKEKQFLENDNQKDNYWKLYTLKESFIKYQGTSIKDLKKIEFKINNNIVTSNNPKLKFYLKSIIPNYMIAICQSK